MAEVKRLDAGGTILISGESAEDVDATLQDLLARGATIITPLSKIGSRWVAACSQAPTVHDSDRTTTLNLRDVVAKAKRLSDASLCRVEEAGLKRIITGPTAEAVRARLADFLEGGCTLVSDVEESFGSWMAVCDTGASRTRRK